MIAAVANNGIGEAGFRAVILYGKTQRKNSPVSRVDKMKSLAEAIAKASRPNQLGRSSGIELVAGDPVAQVKAGEFEVGFEAVVRQTNVQLIAGQLLTRGFKFGTVGEGASECRGNVGVGQITDRLGLVNKFEVENTDRRIQVGANDLAELILGLFERVFRLDHTNAA